MSGIDNLLASSLEKTIKMNLGDMTFHRIQERMFEKFGISVTQSIQEFDKLDYVLREFFGGGTVGLEEKFLENICSVKSKQDRSQKRFTISDETITQSVLRAFSDEESSKILNAISDEPMIITDIFEKGNIPQTSGYRKINDLIENGLVIKDGYTRTANGRKVDMYRSIFDNAEVDIVKNKVTVKVQFSEEILKQSSIFHIVYNS